MPLIKIPIKDAIQKNIRELMKDNEKKWKERWAFWKKRPMKQILAIAINSVKK